MKNNHHHVAVVLMICICQNVMAQQNSINPPVMGKDITGYIDVTPAEAQTSILAIPIIILDVRTPEEFADGHLKDAVNMNYYDADFLNQLKQLDKTKTYLVYCKSGGRSSNAMDDMEQLGFENVLNLKGGITAWQTENFPVVK